MSRDRLLAAGVVLLEDTGELPKIDWVQRSLVVGWLDKETNARREAKRLPAGLGRMENGRLHFGVRAVYEAKPGSNLLEAFFSALRMAWTRYWARKPPADVLLSLSDLVNEANLTDKEARQALELLEFEGLVVKATERIWTVSPAIRHYEAVRTVESYLQKRRDFERKRCRRQLLAKPVKHIKHAMRPDGWIRGLIIATVAILLAAFLFWLGSVVFASPSESGQRRHSFHSESAPVQEPTHSRKSEAARSGG